MQKKDLIIYHTGDLHNHISALKRLSSFISEKSYLLVDSGDAIGGSNTIFSISEPILEFMKQTGYSAMTIGNREFNYIRSIMKKRILQAGFPMLSANLEDLRGIMKDFFTPYIIREIDGIKIGLMGLTPVQYPQNSIIEKFFGLRFTEPFDAVNKYLPEILSSSHLIILLSHLGFSADRKLASEISKVINTPFIIAGGHSHTTTEKPDMIDGILIIHSGNFGRTMGRLLLNLEIEGESCKINNYEYRLVNSR